MTDQQNYESNHEKESLLEENVQPPIVEQDQQKHVPTSVILSLAFYLASAILVYFYVLQLHWELYY